MTESDLKRISAAVADKKLTKLSDAEAAAAFNADPANRIARVMVPTSEFAQLFFRAQLRVFQMKDSEVKTAWSELIPVLIACTNVVRELDITDPVILDAMMDMANKGLLTQEEIDSLMYAAPTLTEGDIHNARGLK
jgi:hypothetical protein